jgi:hypothetical protein
MLLQLNLKVDGSNPAHLFSTTFNLGSDILFPYIFLPSECTCEREKGFPTLALLKEDEVTIKQIKEFLYYEGKIGFSVLTHASFCYWMVHW